MRLCLCDGPRAFFSSPRLLLPTLTERGCFEDNVFSLPLLLLPAAFKIFLCVRFSTVGPFCALNVVFFVLILFGVN